MSRGFNGSRPGSGRLSEAAKLRRLEIMKGGKLPMTQSQRYKHIMKKKLAEHHAKVGAGSKMQFQLPGTKGPQQKMSKKAEEALKQMAAKKAAKEEKALRQMVAIVPRTYPDAGRLDAKGNIYDLAGNIVLKVHAKNAPNTTTSGMWIGKYKNKSMMTNRLIAESIKKYSPYFLKLRQMQLLQQHAEHQHYESMLALGGVYGPAGNLTALDLHGHSAMHNVLNHHHHDENDPHHDRGKVGATVSAWGVMSNNVHGTYAENVWGGMADNVWGSTHSNVWGGIGGDAWGSRRGMKIWGSGQPGQKNYLRPIWTFFTTMLGFKGTRLSFKKGQGSGRHGGSGRAGSAAGRAAAGRTGSR